MTTPFDPTSFNPHDPAFIADPGPTYAQFREHAPVAKVHVALPNGYVLYDAWWVFRHADVQAVLRDKDLFLKNAANAAPAPGPFGVLENMPKGIFSMDPPRHDALRPMLDAMLAQAIAQVPTVTAELAQPLLQAARKGRRMELVNAYAMPLPSSVLMSVLGLPKEHWAGVEQWVSAILAGNDFTAPMAQRLGAGTCAMALGGYFAALMRGCPVGAHAGGMMDMMLSQGVPQGMTLDEIQMTSINLAVAGYLSTVFLIATGTWSLLQQPDQLALLRARPELMANAVQEMVRLDSPVQVTDRVAAADTTLGGVAIKAGDRIGVVVGSANRDPAVFKNPDQLDLLRDTDGHVGFGAGIHFCLGAPLAEKVAPVAFKALFDAFPDLRLDGQPQWMTDPYLRSVANLPLAFG